MVYKVIEGSKGKASCHHKTHKNEVYYLIEKGKNLFSTCYKCASKEFGPIIPIEKTMKAIDLRFFPTDIYHKLQIEGVLV